MTEQRCSKCGTCLKEKLEKERREEEKHLADFLKNCPMAKAYPALSGVNW